MHAEPSMQPHKCQIEGNSHFPGPAGYIFAKTVQDVVGLLCHKRPPLTDIQLVSPRSLAPFLHSHLLTTQSLAHAVAGILLSQVQDFELPFVELHEGPINALLQSSKISLNPTWCQL